MKNIPLFVATAVVLGLTAACQSQDSAPVANSPAASAATQPAAALPAPLPAGAVDLKPGVAEQTPREGYLQVISAKALKAEPMQLRLPAAWQSDADRPDGVKQAPGYRIAYEAVLQWIPQGFGHQQVPASLPLYAPNGRDTLASFRVGGLNLNVPGRERYTVTPIEPRKPLTVRGTLYAFLGRNEQQQPALVVYPYRGRAGGFDDSFKKVLLPIRQ
ncbi:hypothetical protein LJ737_23605 [Hymenobacter sp. 15J16-1T3B]|uniref:hypothetical protein n=1 Tax=Hymenobacter sp. 15J16-1T3B TaxID=2886941 RepID=UPI001D111746|nr:hypothetical protein [Hymenobacter sp. 15J16-1T3B]MCC3160243.1 hypothetical protein [Hymenobacter sp. 15J16-1T3B]